MSVKVSYCPVDRIRELMAFIGRDWKHDHIFSRDEKLLRWQHRHRSDPKLLSVLLADDDDGPVGMLGVIHTDFCHRGERVPSGWLAHWFTKPGARGAPGLKLMRAAMSGENAVLGTARFVETPEQVYRGLGFHVIDAIGRWVARVDKNAFESLLSAADQAFPDGFDAGSLSAATPDGKIRVEPWEAVGDDLWDRTWEAVFAPGFHGACRDSAFLRWRYLEHPRWTYRVWAAHNGADATPRGIAVFRIERIPGREQTVFRILELLFSDPRSGAALARALTTEARAQGCAFADFYNTRSASAAPLEALGFVRETTLERPLPALFQPLDFRAHPINAAFWTRGRDDAAQRYADPDLYMTRVEGDQDRPS